MKKLLFLSFLLLSLETQAQKIMVSNLTNQPLTDYAVEIPLSTLKLKSAGSYMIKQHGKETPVEFITDLYGTQKALFVIEKLKAKEKLTLSFSLGNAITYPKRTYAELAHKIGGKFEGNRYVGGFSWVKPNYIKVDGSFKDHAYYIKYEGPGWESDKVAFRFYLDQRNAIDVFAKKTTGIVLPAVGVDNYETYHHMADWGMDNMKVGNGLGLGSIAVWDGKKAIRVESRDSAVCYIPADGKLQSQVMTTYYGWKALGKKVNLRSLISINAGSRASRMELLVDQNLENLATGILKSKVAELIVRNNPSETWSYIATFGKQSLNDDMMGLALFVRTKQVKEITSDDINHVVVLTPEKGYVEYYFMPTWELDVEPVKTKADFQKCIDAQLEHLNKLVQVVF